MTEDEQLLRLDRLAAIPRNSPRAGMVAMVMATELGVVEKIRRIEAIDRSEVVEQPPPTKPRGPLLRPPKVSAPYPPTTETSPPMKPPPGPPAEVEEARVVRECYQRLTRLPPRSSLWNFLFRELPVLRFSATHLAHDWWPFRFRLTSEAATYLGEDLPRQILPPLERVLALVLREGWKVLTKAEYNLLAGVAQLAAGAREASTTPGRDWKPHWMAWVPQFPLVLRFHSTPGAWERLQAAWNRATNQLSVDETTRLAGQRSLHSLVSASPDGPGLVPILLSLAMAHRRRSLDLGDLLPLEGGPYWLSLSFDAPPSVQVDIEAAVAKLEAQAENLRQQILEVRRLAYFVTDEDVLTPFLGAPEPETEGGWTSLLLSRLLESSVPLFTSPVTMVSGETVVLLRNGTLSSLTEEMADLRNRLWNPDAARVPALVETASQAFMTMGKTLALLILHRARGTDPAIRASVAEQVADPLPYEDTPLAKPEHWKGVTVLEALVTTARVCFAAARRLGDTSLEASLDREHQLEARGREGCTQVDRLASPSRAESHRERWAGFLLDKPTD